MLLSRGARFKVVGRVADLLDLNGGRFGQSQVGKFLTVYPSSAVEAVELAVGLHEATTGLSGPAVPSDRPLREDTMVFYRYGAFRDVVAAGPPAEILMDPEGRLEPDPRLPFFAPPSWANDPFVTSGSATPDPEEKGAFMGRFLIIGALNRSVWGRVYEVIDLEARPAARRVLKQVWHDVAMDEYGRDSRDHAAMEASILAYLPPGGPMPLLHDVIDTGKDVFLVMEAITGHSLGDPNAELLALGSWPSHDVLEFAMGLAGAIQGLHEAGVVHRDVKPANIMVESDGHVRLVDGAFAYRPGLDTGPPLGFGTPGFIDPERQVSSPKPSDDVYSWAATTYLIATGEMPTEMPNYRPLPRARPDLPNAFARAVDQALDGSETRARDFDDVIRLLSHVRLRSRALNNDIADEPNEHRETTTISWTEVARQARQAVVARSKDADGRLAWDPGSALSHRLSPSLYDGVAGLGIALTIAAEDLDDEAKALVESAAAWLCGPVNGHGSANSGLHGGDAGIGLFLLRHATVGRSPAFLSMALARARRLAIPEPGIDDLVDGTAGALLFLVALAHQVDEEERRAQAEVFAEALFSRAIEHPASGGIFWLVRGRTPAERLPYLGLLHGTAGIGLALLQAGLLLGRDNYINAAVAAAKTIQAAGVKEESVAGLESKWPRTLGDGRPGVAAHCHGAGGISQFLIRLWLGTGNRDWLDEAVAGACAVRSRAPRGPTLCHGSLGDAALFIDMAQATGDARYLALAEERTRNATAVGLANQAAANALPGLMLGTAGLALMAGRLTDTSSRLDPILGLAT